MANRKK